MTTKFTKKAIIPVLCILAALAPNNAKANWGAIGNLVSGLAPGIVNANLSSNQRSASNVRTTGTTYYTTTPPPVVHYQEPVVQYQPVQERAPVTYTVTNERLPAQQTRTVIRRRVVSERIIERPGQDPIIETIIEEVPVRQPQPQPQPQVIRYTSNSGR